MSKTLTERLAAALRPFSADVYKPGARRGEFTLTVPAGAAHEAREAMRAYDHREPEVGAVEVTVSVSELPEFKALAEDLAPLLVACAEVKGGKIGVALGKVLKNPLLAPLVKKDAAADE